MKLFFLLTLSETRVNEINGVNRAMHGSNVFHWKKEFKEISDLQIRQCTTMQHAHALVGVWGQTADNKHTGSMIFPFFLLMSKTSRWEIRLRKTSQWNSSSWLTGLFPHVVLLTAFYYSPFKLKLMPTVSNDEFPTEISSRFTNNIFWNDYWKIE